MISFVHEWHRLSRNLSEKNKIYYYESVLFSFWFFFFFLECISHILFSFIVSFTSLNRYNHVFFLPFWFPGDHIVRNSNIKYTFWISCVLQKRQYFVRLFHLLLSVGMWERNCGRKVAHRGRRKKIQATQKQPTHTDMTKTSEQLKLISKHVVSIAKRHQRCSTSKNE